MPRLLVILALVVATGCRSSQPSSGAQPSPPAAPARQPSGDLARSPTTAAATGPRVEQLIGVLMRPVQQHQDIREVREAADELGRIGDPRAVDALVYALYLNVGRANAFNSCARALVRVGAVAAVPRLLATLDGANPDVNRLLQSYATLPDMPAVPPGLRESTAIDVLRGFADRAAVPSLIELVRRRGTLISVREAAAMTLGYTAMAMPRDAPDRAAIFDALSVVFQEGTPGGEDDMASSVAASLVLLDDPRTVPLLVRRIEAREMRGADAVPYRMNLLWPLAYAVHHADSPRFDRLAGVASRQLAALEEQRPDAVDEIAPVRQRLASLRRAADVARDCEDADLTCYQRSLADQDGNVVRKAAYMIAWTVGESPAARQALLSQAGHPDQLARTSIHAAIDATSPHGCAECAARLEQVIAEGDASESGELLRLDTEMLAARIRRRQ